MFTFLLTSTSSLKQEHIILVSSVKSGLWSYVSVCLRKTLTMKEQFQELLTANAVKAFVLVGAGALTMFLTDLEGNFLTVCLFRSTAHVPPQMCSHIQKASQSTSSKPIWKSSLLLTMSI